VVRAKILIWISVFFLFQTIATAQDDGQQEEQEIRTFLQQLFQARAQLLLDVDSEILDGFYTAKEKASVYAKGYEIRRARYIQEWAKLREANIVDARNQIRVVRIREKEDGKVSASVIQTLQVTYKYFGDQYPAHSFGIGIRHFIQLKKDEEGWHVSREYYSDPMEENPNNIPVNHIKPESELQEIQGQHKRYNREKAVAYANKYAGAAWGAGNNQRYNQKYRDYHYMGGDCTNFASQVLADPEGGGLPMTKTWRYYPGQGGSQAWVQTDAFKRFLVHSGYGQVVGYGHYSDLAKPNSRHPDGAIAKLEPGDLIGYEMKKGDVDHFSVVVAKDSKGTPLVNSHTGDRYHVPWDIGWDKDTRFLFIHIRD